MEKKKYMSDAISLRLSAEMRGFLENLAYRQRISIGAATRAVLAVGMENLREGQG
jgi:hypothetical protein